MPLFDGGHAPDNITDVIRHQQPTLVVDDYSDRPSASFAILIHKISKHVDRHSGRLSGREWNENNLIATQRIAIPRPVLAHKRTAAIFGWPACGYIEREPERTCMGPQRVVRNFRNSHQI